MISLPFQLIIAIGLDGLIGDPRWWPHPVRLIAKLAIALESRTRGSVNHERIAGVLTTLLVVVVVGLVTHILVRIGYWFHPLVGDVISITIMYTGIAAHDLAKHALSVQTALVSNDIELSRKRVGMICGRDTAALDQDGVIRATVESVAENTVDGVTAPIFYGLLCGPVGIMVYKAISTLDSTFGYKNDRYMFFGWAPARLDDLAAFVPSRFTGLLVPVAAWVNGMRSGDSFRIFKRDRLNHASPNSGHTEAAFAGALGLKLGGPSYYGGSLHEKPFIGDPALDPQPISIGQSVKLMNTTSVLCFIVFAMVIFCFRYLR
ncbi:MAG: adenosylcobinamide-phosphate synthase CbiB [Desulfomonilaceae bacterium]